MIDVGPETLRVDFERFDLEEYATFLRSKRLPEFQLSFDAVRETYSLRAPSRFADYFGREAPARTVGDVAICTYHKFVDGQIPDLNRLAGLVADESSILKTGGGVIKWNLVKSAKGIEYKLSLTATPAPNDVMEYASQASFLERIRSDGEILWTYFQRDKAGEWKVKPHARDAFYRFMASWSIYLRDPKLFGWTDNISSIPKPEIFKHPIEITDQQVFAMLKAKSAASGQMDQDAGVTERNALSQIAKGFRYVKGSGVGGRGSGKQRTICVESAKPKIVANLVWQELRRGLQVIVWTVFDHEWTLIARELAKLGVGDQVRHIDGSLGLDERSAALDDFRAGRARVLGTKASILGFGVNLPMAGSHVFSGWNDSYEQWYQAIRRSYRYGQTRSLRVHVPYIPELEGAILENVLAKEARVDEDARAMQLAYVKAA